MTPDELFIKEIKKIAKKKKHGAILLLCDLAIELIRENTKLKKIIKQRK